MSFAIKYQLSLYGPEGLKPGDVLLANSPVAGGSHLPDLTVITPVFSSPSSTSPSTAKEGATNEQGAKKPEIIFFTASRGHHADIGGITGGSMPATSTALFQEGASIESFRLVTNGAFDTPGLRHLLVDVPARGEGCSGCRDFKSVESDLRAQVAANHKGSLLLGKLVEEYGLETVHDYMGHIRT
jgi:5-oxoprolinase (ATP-hydrolysing)